jgi:hypothetical protein
VLVAQDLSPKEEIELLSFLDRNSDAFTCTTSDLTGVSRSIIEHKLNVNPWAKPKKQKLKKMSDEKIAAAKAGGQKAFGHRLYQRGPIRNMASKCSHGQKEEQKMVHVHRFYRFE